MAFDFIIVLGETAAHPNGNRDIAISNDKLSTRYAMKDHMLQSGDLLLSVSKGTL